MRTRRTREGIHARESPESRTPSRWARSGSRNKGPSPNAADATETSDKTARRLFRLGRSARADFRRLRRSSDPSSHSSCRILPRSSRGRRGALVSPGRLAAFFRRPRSAWTNPAGHGVLAGLQKLSGQFFMRRAIHIAAHNDHSVPPGGQAAGVRAENLLEHPPRPVAPHRIAHGALARDHTKPRRAILRTDLRGVENKRPALEAQAVLPQRKEILLTPQNLLLGEIHPHGAILLGDEVLATRATASGEHLAAANGLVAGTETALAGAAEFGRTVGGLHD